MKTKRLKKVTPLQKVVAYKMPDGEMFFGSEQEAKNKMLQIIEEQRRAKFYKNCEDALIATFDATTIGIIADALFGVDLHKETC